MIRMCNTIIRMASFVQPPCQGRGPASGGEGTAERMCGVWGDATVACCRAVVRRLCGLCRGVRPLPVCFQSAGRDSRRLRPRSQAPSSKDEARSSAVWNGSLHFDRALWSLHGPLARGGTVLTRCTPGVHREPPESEIREELGRSGLSACDELYYDANHKTAYVRVGCALRHIPRLLRNSARSALALTVMQ